MKKRIFKQGAALMLAAALALPANVVPAEILDQKTGTEKPHIVLNQEAPIEKATDSNAKKEELTGTKVEIPDRKAEARQPHIMLNQENPIEKATDSNAKQEKKEEQIIYNTGSFNVHVVSAEDFAKDLGDAYFEEDGSYTINIPEENPFFPYEVQFTYDGKTENEWFMNPEDSIEIDGHTFYVSASFDGTAVTQMTLDVAGQEVVVYPKEKEFTDGDGVALMSLLPLEKRNLSVDLSGFSPIELSRVKVASIFTGDYQLSKTDAIMWKSSYSDHYGVIPEANSWELDLSHNLSGNSRVSLEMIVGEPDQLAASNIRYYLDISITDPGKWLTASVKRQKEDGSTENLEISNEYYSDNGDWKFEGLDKKDPVSENHRFNVYIDNYKGAEDQLFQVSVKLNLDQFKNSAISKLYLIEDGSKKGDYKMTLTEDGGEWYLNFSAKPHSYGWTDIVASDSTGEEIGFYELRIHFGMYAEARDYISERLYDKNGDYISYETDYIDREYESYDSWENSTYEYDEYEVNLEPGYAVDDEYRLVMHYVKAKETSTSKVLGAYVGKYKTLEEAQKAGASDISKALFDRSVGYAADFSKGIYLSVFVGEDDEATPRLFGWHITTKFEIDLSNSTLVWFDGLLDSAGNRVTSEVLKTNNDDYADYNYITILVDADTDLTKLAPVFSTDKGIKLYTDKEEISGVSLHDFSKGPVHYTASAENSKNSKNYWLNIIKVKQGESWLYMNSLTDENAGTKEENGVVYTTREVMLNGIHDYEHRILLANMGTEDLTKLSVEAAGSSFDSGDVILDDYWTLKGKHDLSGFQGFGSKEDMNLAKIKLEIGTESEANGADLDGTLTIKENGKTIMVITLTGVIGDPGIVTKKIPDAVKYVHYGSMIQNSNKYDFNTVSYKIKNGKLPSGMELKPNGELYGVPLETGEFTFTVQMSNSYRGFRTSSREFTLKVADNTDANVDSAVDQGYDLKERVPNILLSDNNDYTMTSIGVIEEWDNLTLDGKRLVEGVDFDAKSGSTRLTIRSQTLKANNQVGTHTLSAEFREKGTGTLKRAAQNYKVSTKSSGGSSSGGHSSSGRATVRADYGNIGADGAWVQDAKGWKCKAADGTWYTNCWKELTYQNEKSWYRFDAQGYLVTGWYQDNGTWYYMNPKSDGKLGKMMTGWQYINDIWYYFTENAGDKQGAMFCKRWAEVPYNGTVEWYYFDENGTMKTDWLTQDENKFYLYPIADGTRGRMLTGWQKIGDNWYYFHEESDGNKGVLARRTKIGNYYVNSDGVWAK